MPKIPVWLDCDTGIDDSLAILVANKMEQIEIVGISAVSGNVHVSKTSANCIKICDLMKTNIPVYIGADKPLVREYHDAAHVHGEDGLGGATLPAPGYKPDSRSAFDGLYEEAKKQGGKLNVIAIGPLTNLAIAFEKYPDLPEMIEKILIMGGAAKGGNATPYAEYNIYADPHAAKKVFDAPVKVVMCGLDVTMSSPMMPDQLEEIGKINRPVPQFVKQSCKHYLNIYLSVGEKGIHVHDVFPFLYLAYPERFTGIPAGVYVEDEGERVGQTVTDAFSEQKMGKRNAVVVVDVDDYTWVPRMIMEAVESYDL